jgi:hypothetical protein
LLQKLQASHNAETDAEEAVPLVEVVTDRQEETVSILTVNGLEEARTKALVTALEACEGVLKVLPQVIISSNSWLPPV